MTSINAWRERLNDAFYDGIFLSVNGGEDCGVVACQIVEAVIKTVRSRFPALGYYEALEMMADLRADILRKLENAEREQTRYVIDAIADGLSEDE